MNLDSAIGQIRLTRDKAGASEVYARALRVWGGSMYRDHWPALNRAILERGSMSGLKDIKQRAWKLAAMNTTPSQPETKEAE